MLRLGYDAVQRSHQMPVKRKSRSWLRALAALALMPSAIGMAGERQVNLQTIPPGATVEINGSVTCTTPCSIKVPDYYFGAKRTAFTKHAIQPISVRFTKEGFTPKEVDITVGPIHWTNLNGVNVYDYYLVTQTDFNVQLDSEQKFFPQPSGPTGPSEIVSAHKTEDGAPQSTEEIVQTAMPAIVVVSTKDGWGSGFLVTGQGLVVTNAHVVGAAQSVTVTLANGQNFDSSTIFKDEAKDLAFVKIQGDSFPFLPLADDVPLAGADVIAIGSPGLGEVALTNTVTKGIVSAVRQIGDDTWIQTDASINHGNSGGPLLNSHGKVVGVNTLAAIKSEYSGLNFSIASQEIERLAEAHFGVTLTPKAAQADGGSISIISAPAGADVEVDGVYLGSTPCEFPIELGDRLLRISKKGYQPFERKIRILPGAKQTISAELEPESN
jgi:serine protease Do